jgi:DnaJ-class molecular chaperone
MRFAALVARIATAFGLEPDECTRCHGSGGIRIKGGYLVCPKCGGTGKK